MPLTYARVREIADKMILLTNAVDALVDDIQSLLAYNNSQAIDWGAAETPAYIEEDNHGNLAGYQFSRQAVSNAIGSIWWITQLMNNQSLSGAQGNHLGSIHQISNP